MLLSMSNFCYFCAERTARVLAPDILQLFGILPRTEHEQNYAKPPAGWSLEIPSSAISLCERLHLVLIVEITHDCPGAKWQ